MIALDHIAIAATDVPAGAQAVAAALGVALEPGGRHAAMGTWNRLLGLGPGEYLEVIGPDPEAPHPGRPRWFALDSFAGPPAARAWVVRVPDLGAALARAPLGAGVATDFARDTLRWRMAVPDGGVLPWDGLFPALIEWTEGAHPATRLPDRWVRLAAVELVHPDAAGLAAALAPLIHDARVTVGVGRSPTLRVGLDTPRGRVWL